MYGEKGLVHIADTPEERVRAVEACMARPAGPWLEQVDDFLSYLSWDPTWSGMKRHIDEAVEARTAEVRRTEYAEAGRPGMEL